MRRTTPPTRWLRLTLGLAIWLLTPKPAKAELGEPCVDDVDCYDGNSCTYDQCIGGICKQSFTNVPCDDLEVCTSNDMCKEGVCTGTPVACSDGNACTIDACTPGIGCEFEWEPNCCLSDAHCDPGGFCDTDANTCVFDESGTSESDSGGGEGETGGETGGESELPQDEGEEGDEGEPPQGETGGETGDEDTEASADSPDLHDGCTELENAPAGMVVFPLGMFIVGVRRRRHD